MNFDDPLDAPTAFTAHIGPTSNTGEQPPSSSDPAVCGSETTNGQDQQQHQLPVHSQDRTEELLQQLDFSGQDPGSSCTAWLTEAQLAELDHMSVVGTDAQWYHKYPNLLYLVIRQDLNTIQEQDHPMMLERRDSANMKFEVFTSCTCGHQPFFRSPFYHMTDEFELAKQRAQRGAKKNKKFKNWTIVVVDLHDVCHRAFLDQEQIIDLRTLEDQYYYFQGSQQETSLHALRYQIHNKEILVMFKGKLVEHMMTLSDTGRTTGRFIELLVWKEDGYVWKEDGDVEFTGSQPSSPPPPPSPGPPESPPQGSPPPGSPSPGSPPPGSSPPESPPPGNSPQGPPTAPTAATESAPPLQDPAPAAASDPKAAQPASCCAKASPPVWDETNVAPLPAVGATPTSHAPDINMPPQCAAAYPAEKLLFVQRAAAAGAAMSEALGGPDTESLRGLKLPQSEGLVSAVTVSGYPLRRHDESYVEWVARSTAMSSDRKLQCRNVAAATTKGPPNDSQLDRQSTVAVPHLPVWPGPERALATIHLRPLPGCPAPATSMPLLLSPLPTTKAPPTDMLPTGAVSHASMENDCIYKAAPVQEPPGLHPSAAGPTQPVQEPPPPATTEAGADSPDWSPVSGLVECESLEVLTNPTLPDPTAEWEQ